MSRWTEEQQQAINASGCSIIVSAAAGSGKTSVLVERLIRIISDRENPVPIERMIVVTFTNDAAAEMKQRLAAALSSMIEKNPDDSWLSRQNSMLGCASISTIHSFCFDLLRNNINQLSISSGFRILDETEENVLRIQSYKNISERFYNERYDDMITLRNNFCVNDDKPLENLIYSLYKCVSSVPFFEIWLEETYEKYNENLYLDYYEEYINSKLDYCGSLLKNAEYQSDILKNEKITIVINEDKFNIDKIIMSYRNKEYDEFHQSLCSIKFKSFPSGRKNSENPEDRQKIKSYRDQYKEIISDLKQSSELLINAESDLKRHKIIHKILSDFLKEFSSELFTLKEKRNAIGFDDAERLVLDLLAKRNDNGLIEKTPLAIELSEYYKLIMIDEFQDSNNRQDLIFKLLSQNGSIDHYGDNLFFVGDVKQSIYRFRLANPDNFINAINSAVPYSEKVKQNAYIRLNRNFRSSGEVVSFVNYIFKHIMSKECGDIDYSYDEHLIQGASFCEAERNPLIMLFDDTNNIENTEAGCIADKIKEMLSNQTPVSIDMGRGSRPCRMGDFCILLRNRKNIAVYTRELEKRGITVDSEDESGYLKAREISILMNILRVIDNPLTDTALVSVMISPMFMFTLEETAEIRLINKNSHMYINLCEGLGLNGKDAILHNELYTKALFLYEVIMELRLYLSACTLQELIRKIYDNTDFLSVMQIYGDSKRKKANLRMMLEYAGDYEKNSNGGLTGFLRYIDRIMESKGDFKAVSASSGSQNSVSVKTMHKSKGLEYPFVFIAETSTKFSRLDRIKPFQFSYESGLGFKLQNKEKYERFTTLPYEVISLKNQRNAVSEEMRLLYVALTRAKERLFITLNTGEANLKKAQAMASAILLSGGISDRISASANSMEDWLLMTLISHSGSGVIREKFQIFESFRYNEDFKIDYEFYNPEKMEEIIQLPEERVLPQVEMVKQIEDMFNFKYDLSLSALTSKLSVSDISKNEESFETPLKRPEFARESNGLTPAEMGTALHRFLQFTNFKELKRDYKMELERLYNTGYLTQKQKNAIKEDDINAFLCSKLFERINRCKGLQREKKFLIAIDDLELDDELGMEYKNTSGMLNGIIDMVLEFEDYLVLVDYKTDRVSDINELAEKYKRQITLYKLTLEKTEEKPVKEALIYSFSKKSEIRIL